MNIKQKHYLDIDFDNSEADIIQVWQTGREEANVIHIERGEKVDEFIEVLKTLNANSKETVK